MNKKLLQTRNLIQVNKDMVSRQNVREKEHIIVKGMTHMLLDTTMNGIYYPKDEVKLLADNIGSDRVTMPSSHPTGENGEFISASDPWALTSNYVGAYAYNFSVQGDKLISDMAIDPVIANTSEAGRSIINAIENNEPIDVSTGFYLSVEEKSGYSVDGEPYELVASNLMIDHSAFLPNEIGAKNKLEGVGIHTNSARLKDEMIDTHVAELAVNASTPAMKLPLAPISHVFNEAQALENIKAYTNSTDKPSTSYRKFFLNFDQDNASDFEGYTNLFADVINGVPHAIKSQMNDSEHGKAYLNRFDSEMKGNSTGIVKSIINKLFKAIGGEQTTVNDSDFIFKADSGRMYLQQYNSNNGELTFTGEPIEVVKIANEYKPIINESESTKMDHKAKLIALMTLNGMKAKADMTDEELEAELEKAKGDKKAPKANEVDTAVNAQFDAMSAKIDALTSVITANSNKELDTVVAQVVAMNKGIDEATAKTMGLNACNSFLAANGYVAVNARTNQTQTNASDSCSSLKLEA